MILHYVLCQSTNESEFISGPLFQTVKKNFTGRVTPYFLTESVKTKMPLKQRCTLIWKAVSKSKPGDLIILWGPGSILMYILTRFLFRKRFVMFVNLIFNPERMKHSKKSKLLYLMYKDAFQSKYYYANVNGEGLEQMYAQLFHCKTDRFPIVYDSLELSKDLQIISQQPKSEVYVFAGGRAERDVAAFTEIVKQMPDVQFKCVFNKDMIVEEMRTLPNLKIYSDVSFDTFYEILGRASYCCIPLKSAAPCGLVVMQRAALMGIPIVSTETYSMRTIIPDDNYGFLLPRNDIEGMVKKLRLLMENPQISMSIKNAIHNRMNLFTHQKVGEQIAEAVKYIVGKE
ncbi:MAG: glycosyltransferase [Bacteroidaceae bacterium]|nr:glycosyltransferase [Bacteroidaceae bacterium]